MPAQPAAAQAGGPAAARRLARLRKLARRLALVVLLVPAARYRLAQAVAWVVQRSAVHQRGLMLGLRDVLRMLRTRLTSASSGSRSILLQMAGPLLCALLRAAEGLVGAVAAVVTVVGNLVVPPNLHPTLYPAHTHHTH